MNWTKKTTPILIAVAAVIATLAVLSMDMTEAAASTGTGATIAEQVEPTSYGSDGTGIWVSGEGTVSVGPDLATLDFDVEVNAPGVSEANSQAPTAMDAIIDVLKNRGVQDEDIQTSRFSIQPRYTYVEEEMDGVRTGKDVPTGYRIINNVTVKLRDLDAIGAVIDEVTTAGGDVVRINHINFTLEDPKPKMAKLREVAVADAKAKAEHLAELSDISVGRLIYISEDTAAPSIGGFGGGGFGFPLALESAALAAPGVSGGEVTLSLRVQAGFAID